jgi:hypothetical protein
LICECLFGQYDSPKNNLQQPIYIVATPEAVSQIHRAASPQRRPGSALVFDFHYGNDAARSGFQDFIGTAVWMLPGRSGK